MAQRCNEPLCNPKTCINGACVPTNGSSPSGGGNSEQCVCIPGWTGRTCATAVCAPGCGHGVCTNAPGTCTCVAGWAGAKCTIELSWLQAAGKWVTENVEGVYTTLAFAGVLLTAAAAGWANYRAAHPWGRGGGPGGGSGSDDELARLRSGKGIRSRHGAVVAFAPVPVGGSARFAGGAGAAAGGGGRGTGGMASYGTMAASGGAAGSGGGSGAGASSVGGDAGGMGLALPGALAPRSPGVKRVRFAEESDSGTGGHSSSGGSRTGGAGGGRGLPKGGGAGPGRYS
jgi:hypothetical protein